MIIYNYNTSLWLCMRRSTNYENMKPLLSGTIRHRSFISLVVRVNM